MDDLRALIAKYQMLGTSRSERDDLRRQICVRVPALLDRLAAVERDAEKARELLTHARCPQKCTNGTTPYGEQCQWCDERAQLFAAIAARKGEG